MSTSARAPKTALRNTAVEQT